MEGFNPSNLHMEITKFEYIGSYNPEDPSAHYLTTGYQENMYGVKIYSTGIILSINDSTALGYFDRKYMLKKIPSFIKHHQVYQDFFSTNDIALFEQKRLWIFYIHEIKIIQKEVVCIYLK